MTTIEALLKGTQVTERGWIIRILADLVVGDCDATMLRNAMAQLKVPVDRIHFRNHLDYLAEKGYIRLERVRLGDVTNTVAAITAHGRDLRAGVVTDHGVDVHVGEG